MFFKPVKNVKEFILGLSDELPKYGGVSLSKKQVKFIAITMSSMILLGQLCWSSIARATINTFTASALSFMLHHSKIPWQALLKVAVKALLQLFDIRYVHLVIDDTDRTRCKNVRKLFGVFKTRDKKTGGFSLAQCIVFICIVTNRFTLPIGFAFFRPDPKLTKWRKNDNKLKRQGAPKKDRPKAPKRDYERYPTRIGIAQMLLSRAHKFFSRITIHVDGKEQTIRVTSVLADAAYLSKPFTRTARKLFPRAQVVSQLAKNQICWNNSGSKNSLEKYFRNRPAVKEEIRLRGGEKKTIYYCTARLFIKSHGRQLHVIALKYEGEDNYRYIAACDLTWRTLDIIRVYALRWLIEVVIEDWKQYEGFGRKACQQGADGACRGVFLSLLVDCFLLQHPYQLRLYQIGKPLCTVGSLVRLLQFESLIDCIKEIVAGPDPQAHLEKLSKSLPHIVKLRPSSKHMQGLDLPDFGPSPHLALKANGI